MKKRIVSLLICALLVASYSTAGAKTLQFTMNNTNAEVLENKVETQVIEAAPYTKNDRTMVPVRLINEQFGATVGWDEDTKTVTITKGEDVIKLTIDSNTAVVNGGDVALDAAPEQVNDRTMVPVRFVSETLGYNVKYVESTEQVLITDEEPLYVINGEKIFPCELGALMNFEKSAYVGTDVDVEAYVKDELLLFENNYKLAGTVDEEAKNNGVVLTQNIKAQLASAMPKYMETCSEIVLSGAMALVLEKMNLSALYQEYIFGQLKDGIDDTKVNEEYKDTYVCAKHILVSNTNEDAEKNIAEIQTDLKKKTNFDSLIQKYGEDPGMAYSPNGYVFTTGEMVAEFEKAAFDLKENEVSGAVETSYGTHFIKRLALPEITDEVKESIKEKIAYLTIGDKLNEIVAGVDGEPAYTTQELAKLVQ